MDPIKDSALNVISLNIRSLTITDNSVKLKRIFNLDAAIIVLTEVSVDSTAYINLCRLWREQMSRYQVWYSGTEYRGLMIMVKKNSGCYFQNEHRINDDAVLVDFAFPGGKIVNAACVYGPSHKDDKDFWKLVKSQLDLRNSPDGKMFLGDFNVSLNFARDTLNYLTDPHKKSRIVFNQWIFNVDLVDVFEELHPGRSSYTWSRSADILRRDGDPNVRNVAWGKQSRIDRQT